MGLKDNLKEHWEYLTFQNMGDLGLGFVTSIFYWGVIVFISVSIYGLINQMTDKMETYEDKEIEDIRWTKYKIVVPTEQDKKDLEEAFYHIHNSDIDTNYVPVNRLAHEYSPTLNPGTKNNIIVDKELYEKLNKNDRNR